MSAALLLSKFVKKASPSWLYPFSNTILEFGLEFESTVDKVMALASNFGDREASVNQDEKSVQGNAGALDSTRAPCSYDTLMEARSLLSAIVLFFSCHSANKKNTA